MTNKTNTLLAAANLPVKSWFQEIKGSNKTALVGGFGHFINTMIMVNSSRKLMENSAPAKAG
jgi:hypothetical protein